MENFLIRDFLNEIARFGEALRPVRAALPLGESDVHEVREPNATVA
jgi:hypothetical protein